MAFNCFFSSSYNQDIFFYEDITSFLYSSYYFQHSNSKQICPQIMSQTNDVTFVWPKTDNACKDDEKGS